MPDILPQSSPTAFPTCCPWSSTCAFGSTTTETPESQDGSPSKLKAVLGLSKSKIPTVAARSALLVKPSTKPSALQPSFCPLMKHHGNLIHGSHKRLRGKRKGRKY